MAIPHASIARLSSFMMLLDSDPAGEITASLSRDTCRDRGMVDGVRRNMLSGGLLCCFVQPPLCCRHAAAASLVYTMPSANALSVCAAVYGASPSLLWGGREVVGQSGKVVYSKWEIHGRLGVLGVNSNAN